MKRLLLRWMDGRWHLGIALSGQRIVVTTDHQGRDLVNLLPLATKRESDDFQAQLAEAFD